MTDSLNTAAQPPPFNDDPAKKAGVAAVAHLAQPRFNQGDEAMKITRVGMYVNVGMAATKGIVGMAIHSSALIADAAHSLSDLLSDMVTLWSVKVARLPPDPKHPYEALYRATVKIGKQANSKVLIANAWHHRTDAISSFDVAVTLKRVLLDHFDRSDISLNEVHEKDMRPYKEIKRDIHEALAAIPEIMGTTHINTHWLPYLNGMGTVVDVAIIVQPDLKVGGAHAVAKKARKPTQVSLEIPTLSLIDFHGYVFKRCNVEMHRTQPAASRPHTLSTMAADRGILMDFFLASTATSCACVVSNPMEVVKTRMQLQGELAHNLTRGGAVATPVMQYRNFAHAFYTIGRTEGLRGIQRGLGPGISYQVFMNGPRLGLFEPLQKVYGATDPTAYSFPIRNVCAAATSGMIGAFIGSPFFLVKARIQAASSAHSINAQYAYSGMVRGLVQRFLALRGVC
ncbi:hypothetical protein BBJ28_00007572 [Nothophytophthora sp. Chile5]|nr:hypothetical protein BBJ28_00007572 [Nothophytophthora sp. Chile5]